MKFYIADAFTEELFGGNPAGIVLLDDNAGFPSDETMRKTAAELRYSETAFVKQLGEKEFQTRYFTPAAEVELCGHATIGAFSVLEQEGFIKPETVCKNKTLAGELNVEVSRGSVMMDMAPPVFISDIENTDELYEIMGVSYTPGLKPQIISAGLPDILMPLAGEAALAEISPDFSRLSRYSEKHKVVGVHAFTVNTADGHVHCRNFAPLYGIDEEAATGTSNGALTYYLYRNGLLAPGAETCFIQGEKMNRPSKVISRLSPDGLKIQVGGKAVLLARGNILLQ